MSPLTPKLFLSGFFAIIYGLLSYLMLMDLPGAGRLALCFGLATFGTVLLFLLLRDERMARRIRKAEALLPWEPDFQVGANVRQDKNIAGVTVYIRGGEMALLNVRRKEPTVQLLTREKVTKAELTSSVELRLIPEGSSEIVLLTPYMEPLVQELRRNGWMIDGQ